MEVLRIENVSFTYPGASVPVLNGVELTLQAGEWAVLCGATGCGKSTLLKMLKPQLTLMGSRSGSIFFENRLLSELPQAEAAAAIGYVTQNPDEQIVCDKVWHELAFGAENLHLPRDVIARRVAETADFFGLQELYDRPVSELSGGQKQLLNLASVMVMQPRLLLLDEPTAQLDPIAAEMLLNAVAKINRELGVTVLMTEHRLQEAVPLCDRLLVLQNGTLAANDKPAEVIAACRKMPLLLEGMPCAARIALAMGETDTLPLTVREGRSWLRSRCSNRIDREEEQPAPAEGETVLTLKDVGFRYGRHTPDVLCGTSFTLRTGEVYCLLGGNGSGKSTLMNVAAGLRAPYTGSVKVLGKKVAAYRDGGLYRSCVAMLPQNVCTVFLASTLRQELKGAEAAMARLDFDFAPLMDRHPYDLSGGEMQMAALAKVLSGEPKILLLDEPTKGLDARARNHLAVLLKKLAAEGLAVLTVTHDAEFAALCADRCGLLFRGRVVSEAVPAEFFSENRFYTTAAARIAQGFYHGTVTVQAVVELAKKNPGGGSI